MSYSLTAPSLPEGAQEFIDHVLAQPINEWHDAPLSKKGKRLTGDTAGGQAVETMLNIAVNNSDGPDIPHGRIEVKAGRSTTVCPVTLLTKAPCAPKGANRNMVTNYGYTSEHDPEEQRLMISLNAASTPSSHRDGVMFDLAASASQLTVTADGVTVAEYHHDALTERAEKKLGGILAYFETDTRFNVDGHEQFRIKSLVLHWGYNPKAFWSGIGDGSITIEPRLKKKGKKVRDRGTAFRCAEPSALYAHTIRVI